MLHAAVISLSAFLIFLVQPLIAKQILPWFGGSAAVWTTCLLFFQTALLAGYAYAHGLNRWCTLRQQAMLHSVLLFAACAVMPIVVAEHWRPVGGEEPIAQILLLLGATIGLPYFLLATTTPLAGSWYWKQYRASAPYRLFALSNFASLLALLGYPLLIEPYLGNRATALGWSGLFVLFALLCASMAWRTVRSAQQDAVDQTSAAHPATPDGVPPAHAEPCASPADAVQPTDAQRAPRLVLTQGWPSWIVLAALGSAVLMGVSTHLTQNISSAPLLWVIPLALYLLTFIICFDHPRWYVRGLYLPLGGVSLALMAWLADSLDLALAAPIYAFGLFVLCMVCHGELHRLRPEPQRLTQFYLGMAAGGALGSLLMGVVAPLLLAGHYEFQIVLTLLALVGFVLRPQGGYIAGHISMRTARILSVAVLAAVCVFNANYLEYYRYQVRSMERDFYGVVRTRDREGGGTTFRNLVHGGIAHGGQHQREDLQMTGSSYFGPDSGYGRVFRSLDDGPKRVGVIGLGAGALAVYARSGDHWVFYEISPAVVRAATREFSFLARMQGSHEIVVGDGRLALEREAARQFDVIAMDAFAGDSIPVHFLTREAMALYVKHLKPEGAIVFQATNRFVNPMPVIRQLADAFGLQAVLVSDSPDHSEGPGYWLSSTDQVIVTRNTALLQATAIREVAQPIAALPGLSLFTDDYVNLLRILKH